jgi:hypothetical protein
MPDVTAPAISKEVTAYGRRFVLGCDAQCSKAWGAGARPRVLLSADNPDDYAYLADHEIGAAPVDPGTGEGGDGKPLVPSERLNRWCFRACERARWAPVGEPLPERDLTRRRYNVHARQRAADESHARGEPDPNGDGARVLRP